MLAYLLLAVAGFAAWTASTIAGGGGALSSNWLARRILRDMKEARFRAIVIAFMVLSGLLMLWEERETLATML